MNDKTISLYLPLVGFVAAFLWPIFHLLNYNFEEFGKFGFSGIWQIAVICLGGAAAGLLVLLVLFRLLPNLRLPLVTTFTLLTVFFFFFGVVHGGLIAILTWAGVTRGAGLGYIAILLGLVALIWAFRRADVLHRFVAVFVLIGCGLPLAGTVVKAVTQSGSGAGMAKETSASPRVTVLTSGPAIDADSVSGENVYYIIVDGYVGDRNLKKVFDLDNGDFIERMKAAGFYYVEDSRSNYVGSASSIGSLFHADYFRDETTKKGDLPPADFFPIVMNRVPPPYLLDRLLKADYGLFLSESWYSACKDRYFKCIGQDSKLALNQESQLVLETTPLPRIMPRLFAKKVDALSPISDAVIRDLKATSKPFFLFAHHMQPHSPWYFDSACNFVDTSQAPARVAFRDAVLCANRMVIDFVERVVAQDPGAIIVVQGDHGSGFIALEMKEKMPESRQPKEAMDERTENISFIRAPAECQEWLKPTLGPLNTVRFVLGCIHRTKPTYLPEHVLVPGPDYDETEMLVRYEGL